MAREVKHSVTALRFVAVGLRDHGPGIVGHNELRHAAIETQRPRRRFKPVGHRFARRGAGVGIAGGAQGGHEDVGPAAIGQADGRTVVIDEQLLASTVDLTHQALELPSKAPVILAVLGVGIGVSLGMVGAILFPQQHQRYALATQFLMQATIVGLNMVA